MTPQEAIKFFEDEIKDGKCSDDCTMCNASELAISALEKQIPEQFRTYTYYPEDKLCPICYEDFTDLDCLLESGEKYKFCPACGQALDWSDEV